MLNKNDSLKIRANRFLDIKIVIFLKRVHPKMQGYKEICAKVRSVYPALFLSSRKYY